MLNARVGLNLTAACCLFLIAFASPRIDAQSTSPNHPTLADALKIAAPPDPGTVLLTVNGDQISPLKDAPQLVDSPGVQTIAADYGLIDQSFGDVTAIAPSTMIVLNTAPSEPDVYANLPPYVAFTFLVSSLTDSEWNELISEQGLPLSELDTDWQKMLIGRLLSKDGKLIIRPNYRPGDRWSNSDVIDATDSIPGCRMRMGHTLQINLPIKGETGQLGGGLAPVPADGTREWEVSDGPTDYEGYIDPSNVVAYGSRSRAEVPNVSKESQLDYSAPVLQRVVSLVDLKSVGDLFARISIATGVELYVDPRLDQSLQVVGAHSARASDLLQAVALCQTATYRQVGPAFVLTDDLAGVGTRRQLWSGFEQLADTLRRKLMDDAERLSYKKRSPKDIPWFGDPGQFTPAQESDTQTIIGSWPKMLPSLRITFAKLTPGQQAMAQAEADEVNGEIAAVRQGGQPLTTDGNIDVEPALNVVLLVPGMTDPVSMGVYNDDGVFVPDQSADVADRAHAFAKDSSEPTPEALTSTVTAFVHASAIRAVLVQPRTAAGVDADISAMKKLGLNQMWLDIFSDGQAHIPGSPLSALAHPLKLGENDILTEAVAKGKASGIAVYPVMDLFYWGTDPPADVTDLNIFGESSAQEEARWNQRKALLSPGQELSETFENGAVIPDFPGVAVAPTDAAVRSDLLSLARLVAARPGIGGIILRDTDPPGYDLAPGSQDVTADLQLGYVLPARLAFLRKYHADPVDLYPTGWNYTGFANTDLPNFEYSSGLTKDLWTKWAVYRREADLQLMADLFKSATEPTPLSSSSAFTVIVKQRRHGGSRTDSYGRTSFGDGWYGSWDSIAKEPPTLHGYEDNVPGQPQQTPVDEELQPTQQSRHVYTPISRETLNIVANNWKWLSARPNPFATNTGFVLDLSDDPFGDNGNGSDPLTNLVSEMASKSAAVGVVTH